MLSRTTSKKAPCWAEQTVSSIQCTFLFSILQKPGQLIQVESLLLMLKDVREAEGELNRWLWWVSHSRIPAFKELYRKIKRHKSHILNTIRLGMSNARIETTNNKIKLIIRKAYGFRNIQNMLDMVYLVCSDLRVPLPNLKSKAVKSAWTLGVWVFFTHTPEEPTFLMFFWTPEAACTF